MKSNRTMWKLWLGLSLLAAAPAWGNSINLSGCQAQIAPGGTVSCSVSLTLDASVSIDFLTFSASITPGGGAPAATGVAFSPTLAGLSAINGASSGGAFGSVNVGSGTTALGTLSFTVPVSAAGNQTYAVAFTNAQGSKSSNNVAITSTSNSTTTVIGVLTITAPTTLTVGTVGTVYPSVNAAASGGVSPYTFSATGLPSGLTVNGAGLLSGTPAVGSNGSYTVALKVTDSQSATTTSNIPLTIDPAISISTASLNNGNENTVYVNVQAAATGGNGSFTWTATGLPSGLGISSGGLVSGTPAVGSAGNYAVTLKATDSTGAFGTRGYNITIAGPLGISSNSPLPTATELSAYSATVIGGGGTAPYTWSVAGPAWISINGSGVLSGTPPAGSAGDTTVTVTLKDSANGTVNKVFALHVNTALTISASPALPTPWTVGVAYPSTTLAAAGGGGPYTWSAPGLPAGLTIGSGTGTVSGTPTAAFSGNVTVTVTDVNSVSTTRNFPLVVNAALNISSPAALPGATVSTAYSQQVTVTGGTGPYTWSAPALPANLTITGNGTTATISGSPAATGGPTNVTVTVTDAVGATTNKVYSLTVNTLPSVGGPATLPVATVSSAYNSAATITFSGGTAPINWSATNLPNGLTIAGGVISGTPTTNAGSPLTINVTATDANGATSSKSFGLTVNPALVITGPASLPVGIPNVAYTATTIQVTGGAGAPYTFTAPGLPAGLTINGSTGQISGTPTTNNGSPFAVVVTVKDSNNVTTTKNYSLFVNPPLSISGPASLPAGTANVPYPGASVTATGGSGGYVFTATGLPPGLQIDPSSGAISGTPSTNAGSPYSVVVKVTDSSSTSATQNYSLQVAALPLKITTFSLPLAIINTPYQSTTLTASGGVGSYTFAITGLPPGLTANGPTITGTPTTTTGSPFTVNVTLTDSSNTSVSTTFPLTVSATLAISTPAGPALPTGAVGAAYPSTPIVAGGGKSPYTYTATGLPAGLTIGLSSGIISGTPTATATNAAVVVTVTDALGATAVKNYTLTVNGGISVSGPASLPSGTVGVAYTSTTVTAVGGSGTYTWSASGLPAGLTINSATGAITGTPTVTTGNPYPVVVTVTDSLGATANKGYQLTIIPSNSTAPVISSVSNSAGGQAVVAPNTYISIYGSNFAAAADDWTAYIKANAKLPTTLDGITVNIGGQATYINFVSPTQINVVTPNIGLGPVQVTVTTPAGTSAAFNINSQQFSPAFFPWPGNQPVASHLADSSLAAKAGTFPLQTTIPAAPGEVIVLWGTGFGPVTPTVTQGVPLPRDGNTYVTTNNIAVSINNGPATVFQNVAALAPTYAWLYQMSVTVPPGLQDGDYTITATVGGVTTPVATLTVHK